MKKTIYILGIVLLAGLSIFILPIWNVHTIQVEGASHYTQEEIEKAIDYKPRAHILTYSKEEVKRDLEALAYVKNAEVEYGFPNQVIIHLTERVAVGYIEFLDGLICIDEEGYVLKQVEGKQEDLPIIEGIRIGEFRVGEILEIEEPGKLATLKEMMNTLKKYQFVAEIDTIDLTNIEQIHLYVNNLNVIIGNMREFDQKVKWLIEVQQEYVMGILDLTMITGDMKYDQAILKPLN